MRMNDAHSGAAPMTIFATNTGIDVTAGLPWVWARQAAIFPKTSSPSHQSIKQASSFAIDLAIAVRSEFGLLRL